VCVCRFQQAELVHARTAMVGVAGILIPDVRFSCPPAPRDRRSMAWGQAACLRGHLSKQWRRARVYPHTLMPAAWRLFSYRRAGLALQEIWLSALSGVAYSSCPNARSPMQHWLRAIDLLV